jgi:hypothetical protein
MKVECWSKARNHQVRALSTGPGPRNFSFNQREQQLLFYQMLFEREKK